MATYTKDIDGVCFTFNHTIKPDGYCDLNGRLTDKKTDTRYVIPDNPKIGCWQKAYWESVELRPVALIRYTGAGYYQTDLVGQANRETIDEMGHDDHVVECNGQYAIYLDGPIPTDLVDVLNDLDSYCILDDDRHSELETEEQNRCWDEWARDQWVSAHPELDALDSEQVDTLYWHLCQAASVWPEGGDDVSFPDPVEEWHQWAATMRCPACEGVTERIYDASAGSQHLCNGCGAMYSWKERSQLIVDPIDILAEIRECLDQKAADKVAWEMQELEAA